MQQRARSQIERYRIKGRPDDAIEQLSGGNQQRVLIGLLPDEPQLLALEQPTPRPGRRFGALDLDAAFAAMPAGRGDHLQLGPSWMNW